MTGSMNSDVVLLDLESDLPTTAEDVRVLRELKMSFLEKQYDRVTV